MAMNHRAITRHRLWSVWFALCIALVMALAPTVSHAVAWSLAGNGQFMEVCTATARASCGCISD